jgi:hypothetical protein
MDIIPCNCRQCEEVGCKQSVVTYRALLDKDTKKDLRVNSFVAALRDQILASAA